MTEDDKNPKRDKQPDRGKGSAPMPPAGPHARKDLTDPDKTPGTGSLPDPGKQEADIGPD